MSDDDEVGQRTTVNVIPADRAPGAWFRTLHLARWLLELFGDGGIIEIDEVHADDDQASESAS